MSKYTPNTKQVRRAFVFASSGWERATSTAKAGFRRWLKSIQAEAWEEGWRDRNNKTLSFYENPYTDWESK